MPVTLNESKHHLAGKVLCLSNEYCELVITLDLGPRVLSYSRPGEKNIFAVFESQFEKILAAEWRSFGGHRLWHAPEVMPRTYAPDNMPVQYRWEGNVLTLLPEVEEGNKLSKELTITLDENSSQVDINHSIQNTGPWAIELAAWCLSVMAPDGEVIVPQERFIPHPDCLVPARPLVLWHFTHMDDPRFSWGRDYIRMKQDNSHDSKQKFGVYNRKAWAAYLRGNDLFLKTQALPAAQKYPDMGCNQEFFTMPDFLEIESLSPLRRLEPEGRLNHPERWTLTASPGLNYQEIERRVAGQGHPVESNHQIME